MFVVALLGLSFSQLSVAAPLCREPFVEPLPSLPPSFRFEVTPLRWELRYRSDAGEDFDIKAVNDKLDLIGRATASLESPQIRRRENEFVRSTNNLPLPESQSWLPVIQDIISMQLNAANWRVYSKNFYLETLRWTRSHGTPEEQAALEQGKVSRRAVFEVLKHRFLQRGQDVSTIEVLTREDFFEALSHGPVFDQAFGEDSDHGQFPHLLQLDYISLVFQAHRINPQAFHRFLNTPAGRKYWDAIFERAGQEGLMLSPGMVTTVLGNVLPIKDSDSL